MVCLKECCDLNFISKYRHAAGAMGATGATGGRGNQWLVVLAQLCRVVSVLALLFCDFGNFRPNQTEKKSGRRGEPSRENKKTETLHQY